MSEARLELKVKATRVYERNFRSTSRIVINVGGARSSKSYSILQLIAVRLISRGPYKALITRKTGPALKASCYTVMLGILSSMGMLSRMEHNKTDRTLTYRGNLLAFISIDDPEKIKSTEWNDIFMEEANEFTYEDYVVLKTRLSAPGVNYGRNQMFLAFNPSEENGYIHTRVEHEPDVEVIHSTYKDNPFLAKEYVEVLQGLEREDPTYYKIYALGEYATPTGIIYPKWNLVDLRPESPDETFYGIDFGFNNPAALVRVDIKDMEATVDELLYKTQLTNTELVTQVKDLIGLPMDPLYADASEPDRIEELAQAGFNVFPANKDVAFGIDTVKRYKINLTKRSVNAISEIRGYKWRVDRAGLTLDEPVKFKDHAMDAIRYALHTHTGSRFVSRKDLKDVSTIPLISHTIGDGF